MPQRACIAIDLKSFYASVECLERGLDPLTTHLVVADESRTEKTICLAVTPSLKAYGLPGRCRLFEVVQKVREINSGRLTKAPGHQFTGESSSAPALAADPGLSLTYVVARPQMALYMKRSTEIYQIYLKYVAPEDIHVYSIDEVFMDVTHYLATYHSTAKQLAQKIIADVLTTTGITATAGIGTNLYLCKVAMDIVAKHIPPDQNGVRIAELDEMSYREKLWSHTPLTDFWRVGRGYARRLESVGLHTMGDIARCSLGSGADFYNEDLLYKMFGVNAELLIDHAWGWEPCTIADIQAYEPENNSVSSGQVLPSPYSFEKARLVVREMADMMTLDLAEKGLVTDQLTLSVRYDNAVLQDPSRRQAYHGPVSQDRYGRDIPKSAHGSVNIPEGYTSSDKKIVSAAVSLYEQIVDRNLLVRQLYLGANHVIREAEIPSVESEQLDLFTDYEALAKEREQKEASRAKEKSKQQAVLEIRRKFGKNAILKGTSLEDGATAKERNQQIGGHRA